MKIYVVRHGQSTHNANLDTPHTPDPPLTAIGRQQAEFTAASLGETDISAVAVYVSPHRRALETVVPIQSALGLNANVVPDLCEAGGLREHPGMSRDEILKEWPEVIVDERITAAGWWTRGLIEDEEAEYYSRAEQAIGLLRGRHAPGETVVVVTHGRFGSALISSMMGHGPAGYHRFPLNNCAISRIDYDPHELVAYGPPAARSASPEPSTAVRLMFHNQNSHLPLDLRT